MREYKIGDVVQVTKSGKHNGKIGVIVSKGFYRSVDKFKYQCCVSFDLNEVPLDKTFDFYNSRNGVNSSWYNASNVEYATYNDANNYLDKFHGYYYRDYDVYYGEFVSLKKKATLLSRYAVSVSSDDTKLQGEMLSDKYFCINEVDREKLVNTVQGAIQFKKEDPLYKENIKLKQRIQELEEELDNTYFDVAERDRRINDLEQERNKISFLLNYGNCNAQYTIDELREYFASNIEEPSMGDIIKEINNLKKELVYINEKIEQVHRLSII